MFFNVKPRYNTNTSNIDTKKKIFLHFDDEFYKKTYNDLQKENIVTREQCLAHYVMCGMKEGRCCCEEEMIQKYKKNRENAIKQISSYPLTKPVKLNILIRTSDRPQYFEKCIHSILQQEYENYHVYVCYDNMKSLDYLQKYENHPKITYFYVNIASNEKYKFNLYCNLLLDRVNDGYIMFLDDDDIYLGNRVFEIINQELRNHLLLCWKFLRPDKLIYPKNIQSDIRLGEIDIRLGEIDTSCVCFHVSLKKISKWNDQQYGDFHFYKPIFKDNQSKKFIDFTLTATQFNNKIGNYGENI